MDEKFLLYAAGNTVAPVYHLLIEKGYSIKLENDLWIAANKISEFRAEDLLMLAGLIFLFENKGKEWRVRDDQIEEFIEKYHLR